MSMHIRTLALGALLSACLLSPAVADDASKEDIAQDLSGTYTVKGQDPAGTAKYEGEVAVMKLGETYRVAWAMEDHRAVGTGILTAKTFAVTFISQGMPVPGIAVFDVGDHGELSGRFTLLGARDVGLETWTPQTH
jgi:hypothetical protein